MSDEAVRQRDALLSLVSHDLKNPLMAISGSAELLRRQAEQADMVDSARTLRARSNIARAAMTMTRLINFQRASNVDGISGTGIGLAGARQIVTEHGGTLGVQTEMGGGTVATMRLRLARETDAYAGATTGPPDRRRRP